MSIFKRLIAVISIIAAIIPEIAIENSDKQPQAAHPYFLYFLLIALAATVLLFIISFFNSWIKKKLELKGVFWAGAFLFFNILNIVTSKYALLPLMYFPSPDRILAVLAEDYAFLAKCLAYSFRLLFLGWFSGAAVGITTGICIGFSKRFSYWIRPLVRILGPIPSTAWIPLVLVCFPTVVSASAFLIALAVWFPTTVLTSSGIANVKNSYFEVASTLGASEIYKIFKVGVPAAMPHMFLGLFNGTSTSFVTLVTAEMIGAKYGIGWYLNWQKEMMSYANVYAGLIIIAVTFFVLVTLLFKLRDKLLLWQKGIIKW